MNMVTFHLKKEEWREAFSVKVPSPFERSNNDSEVLRGVLALCIWGTKNITHLRW